MSADDYDDYDLNNPEYHPDSDEVTLDERGVLEYEDGYVRSKKGKDYSTQKMFNEVDKKSNDLNEFEKQQEPTYNEEP